MDGTIIDVLVVEDDPGEALLVHEPVDLDEFGRTISIIDACFLRLAEPALGCQRPAARNLS